MIAILMALVALVYLIIGILYFKAGNTGLGIAFISYAVANLGIYVAGVK
jgi:hypothetical protein